MNILLKRTLIAVATSLTLQAAAAQPDPPIYAMHNGSIMTVFADRINKTVVIVYAEPKPSLITIGVQPGTLLFDGTWDNGVVRGYARVYNLVCGAIPYAVSGGLDPSGALVLRGPQLRVNQFCQPYYYEWTQNSVLVFTIINQQGELP